MRLKDHFTGSVKMQPAASALSKRMGCFFSHPRDAAHVLAHASGNFGNTGYFFKKVLRWGAWLTSPGLTFRARGEVGAWYGSRVTVRHRVGKGTTVSQNRQSQSPAFLIGRLAVRSAGICKSCTDEPGTVRCSDHCKPALTRRSVSGEKNLFGKCLRDGWPSLLMPLSVAVAD